MATNTNVKQCWMRKPSWYLYYKGLIVACWYCDTKREAKALALQYTNGAKERNSTKKKSDRVYKKDFVLKPHGKGANDA